VWNNTCVIEGTQVGIGARIKEAREDLGLTQAALGLEIAVAARTVQSWELNERVPRLAQLQRLALRTDRPISWFYEAIDSGPVAA
jgi:transcriptional regulator with XRE-family HTH domain